MRIPTYLKRAIDKCIYAQGCGCCGRDYEEKKALRKKLNEAIRKFATNPKPRSKKR